MGDFSTNYGTVGGIPRAIGYAGGESGQGAKYADIAQQKCAESFKQTWRGGAANGIAGAGLTASPEFKTALAQACPPKSAAPPPMPQVSAPPQPAAPPAQVGGNMTMPPPPGAPYMNLSGMRG